MRLTHLCTTAALFSILALPAFAQTAGTAQPAKTPAPAAAPAASHAPAASGKLVDINNASASELDALPGVGPARADAIIKNRPYKGKDDLLSRRIVPKNVYEGIKDKIIARQG